MHYQAHPHAEAKLIRCCAGAIYDVVLDLRRDTGTHAQWFAIELSAANCTMLYVPEGCAHGFQTLADDTQVFYQISDPYHAELARGVRWNDPRFRHRLADSGPHPLRAGPHIPGSLRMTRVLITGATGFIGRNCLSHLIARGYEVHATTREKEVRNPMPHVSWHQVDLLKPGAAAHLLGTLRPECLLHFAWYAEPGNFWHASENIEWVRATLELFSAFAKNGGRRIVAAGTCAEYDLCAGECHELTTPLSPNSLYGGSKHAVERILYFSNGENGVSSAWGRAFFLYGPGEHPSRLVAYVVNSLLQGRLLLL